MFGKDTVMLSSLSALFSKFDFENEESDAESSDEDVKETTL